MCVLLDAEPGAPFPISKKPIQTYLEDGTISHTSFLIFSFRNSYIEFARNQAPDFYYV
jgi:hypothetical protein